MPSAGGLIDSDSEDALVLIHMCTHRLRMEYLPPPLQDPESITSETAGTRNVTWRDDSFGSEDHYGQDE